MLRTTSREWGSVARFFHWSIVLLVIAQFVLANLADSLPLGVAKLVMLARHKSVGITILALAVMRLAWRFSSPAVPPLPGDLKPYERFLAHVTHWGLYALLFAMPLSGWLMSSAKNYPVSWFGIVQLPDLVAPHEGLFDAMVSAHHAMATALFVLAVLHVLAALRHHFVKKDDVLKRMLPFAHAAAPPEPPISASERPGVP